MRDAGFALEIHSEFVGSAGTAFPGVKIHFLEQVGDSRQRDRCVISEPGVDSRPCVLADKEGVVPEVLLKFFIRVRSDSKGLDVEDLSVEKSLRVCRDVVDQSTDKVLWFAACGADEDSVSPVDVAEDPFIRGELLREKLFKLIKIYPLFHFFSRLFQCQETGACQGSFTKRAET
jgi:hypothetical protein